MSSSRRDTITAEKLTATGLHLENNTVTLAGALTIPDTNAPSMQVLDSGASARVVTLPDVALNKGKVFFLFAPNATGAVTYKNAATTTIVVNAVGKGALVWSDGVTWMGGTLG